MFTTRHRRDARQPLPDERVTALLEAASAPAEPGPASGESAALAAFRAAHQTTPSRRSRVFSSSPLRTAAAAVLGTGVLLSGGIAAAQAGSLPASAQSVAHEMLASLGVSVPGPSEHADGHAGERGASTDAPREGAADTRGPETPRPAGTGTEISELARSNDDKSVKHGEMVSDMASGGTSRAGAQGDGGQHGQAGEHGRAQAPGQPSGSVAADEHAPVTTPNTGDARPDGAGTGGSAAGDASASGRGTADSASAGRSTAGSDNASPPTPPDDPAGGSPDNRT